jgi:tripartite ATP-independent transporter DctP family solute receptor
MLIKKGVRILACIFVISLFLGCFMSSIYAEEKITLRLGSPVPDTNPFTIGCKKFAEIIEEKTNGEVVVKVFAHGQLGGERELIESAMCGTIDLVITSTGPLNAWIPEVLVFDLPYLFRDREHFYKTLDSPICDKIIAKPLEDLGIKVLSMWDSGDRNFFTTDKKIDHPIHSPDDFKGLRIRVMENPIYIEQVKAMGGHPVAMPFTEVYTSFQQGMIDGADNNVMNYYTTGFCEVAKFLSLTAHAYLPGFLGINKEKFDEFSPELKEIFMNAAKEAGQFERDYFVSMTNKTLEKLIQEKGVTIDRNPDKKAFFEATKYIYKDYEEKVGGKEVIDAIINIK